MQGLMMDYPLTLTHILDRSHRLFPHKEIATKTAKGMHRYTYADMYARAGQLANALNRLGVSPDGRVATFAWNTYRHLEIYFAAPCSGRVLHTLNIRLFPDQVVFIANHAEDEVVIVDASLLPAIERLAPQFETVRHYVVMCDGPLPATTLPNAISYEDLLAGESPDYAWPQLPENSAAAMCYTSGTTGNPKGAVYSHRGLFLHSMMVCVADAVGLSERDIVLPVVPMFHANSWGLPHAATLAGAKQVFPGPFLDGKSLADLIQGERVTIAAGVPTIWMGLLQVLEKEHYDLSSIRAMPVGGSAAPQSMIERYQTQFGASILHAWGMTEMAPIGTVSNLKSHMLDWPADQQFAIRAKQGTTVPLVEARIVDPEGLELPWDGQSFGELQVRGPWIISSYYRDERSGDSFQDGWFRTGDVATIDAEGYIQIVDRTKDLVKSGGEWISTVDLENVIMAHPKVLEAAVIAVQHPRWQERPMACVVPKPDFADSITSEEILEFLGTRVAKWQLPDEVMFIEGVPKTSVGKFDKKVLRERFKDHQLPDA
ncbi:MAG: long-chain fatty acid--CoA ligase [Kouleothrix sp.]|nr:long-chain fatty acid--CoA ligase [Kouleothrix sp.]